MPVGPITGTASWLRVKQLFPFSWIFADEGYRSTGSAGELCWMMLTSSTVGKWLCCSIRDCLRRPVRLALSHNVSGWIQPRPQAPCWEQEGGKLEPATLPTFLLQPPHIDVGRGYLAQRETMAALQISSFSEAMKFFFSPQPPWFRIPNTSFPSSHIHNGILGDRLAY